MASAEFLRLLDALRQASAARDRAGAERALLRGRPFNVDGLAYRPGDQVIDLVSGQTGVVLAGERHTLIVAAGERPAG